MKKHRFFIFLFTKYAWILLAHNIYRNNQYHENVYETVQNFKNKYTALQKKGCEKQGDGTTFNVQDSYLDTCNSNNVFSLWHLPVLLILNSYK